MTVRDERKIIRGLYTLRSERASFTAKRNQEEAGIRHVSNRTVRRCLNKHGYRYRQSRKKGLVSDKDRKRRSAFARAWVKKPIKFWTDDIAFYFDGVSFAHKYHPYGEARSTSNMAWRKPKEGLLLSTKGRKEGSGGRMACFFVAIAHGKGVVLCEQYTCKPVTGEFIADFIKKHFPAAFSKAKKSAAKMFLQDGDPKQVSAKAKKQIKKMGYTYFDIPARSPDFNPIENMFHVARKQLKEDAIELKIENENYEQFSTRVKKTIESIDISYINRTIESMKQRMANAIQLHGARTKY